MRPPGAGKEAPPPPSLQRDWPRRLASDRPLAEATLWSRPLDPAAVSHPGGPKARGGARLGNWPTLTLKPRPVAGGSLERETNREPG